jgi:hypothetical protein
MRRSGNWRGGHCPNRPSAHQRQGGAAGEPQSVYGPAYHSRNVHRYKEYLAWYDKYVKGEEATDGR